MEEMLLNEQQTLEEAEICFFNLIKKYPNLRKITNAEKIELMRLWPRIRNIYYNPNYQLNKEKKIFSERMNGLVPHHKSITPKIIYNNIDGKELECLRCNHKWKPIKPVIHLCPKCKSRLWNQKKK
jgi:hypothetical protein